ncbi:MAG TPA: Ig-like domain-containing protein [Saprospiraceae bacterium]|nr:hypothetical protein [Lewinellaceae bacterium]HPG09114.1 Ig-like domain-containing protein [Saprospiraceae bacterium]HRV85859.1 Ig-like domain-containing protein [Saprospiraceae bacterium]
MSLAFAGMLGLLLLSSCKKEPVPFIPPEVEFITPTLNAGNVFPRIVDIEVKVTPSEQRTIERVEFYIDGDLLGDQTDYSAPYTAQWEATDKFGELRTIETVAYDNEGQAGSASIQLQVWDGIELAPMPTSRYGFTSEVVNNKIYVIGGSETKKVEAYDPATNSWETKAEPIHGHFAHASCVLDNKIYVFGGDEGFNWITANEMYDPVTNTWAEKAPIPIDSGVAVGIMAAVAYQGKAYLFGGNSSLGDSVRVGVYDPKSDSWSIQAIKSGFSIAGTVLNDQIYVSGGCPEHEIGMCANPSNQFEIYNPATQSFESKPPSIYHHSGHVLCTVNGKIYAIGGVPDMDNTQMEFYDPASNGWTALPSMPIGAIDFGCGVVNGKIYIIGQKVYVFSP